jgi:hypothetical protein
MREMLLFHHGFTSVSFISVDLVEIDSNRTLIIIVALFIKPSSNRYISPCGATHSIKYRNNFAKNITLQAPFSLSREPRQASVQMWELVFLTTAHSAGYERRL